MSVYVTRHGQTDWNIGYVIQGRMDTDLNEEGIKQAKALHNKCKDIHFDVVFSSPLKRAIETAKAIIGDRDIELRIDERIIEMSYGDFEGVSRKEESYHKQRNSFFKRYPNGESYLDVAARVYDFLKEMEKTMPEKDILIVCHGGMSRVVHTYFSDLANDEFIPFALDNCELAKYEWPQRDYPLMVEPK